ncbi:epidermal growth factor receptor substrate 15-like 1 isoform X1 [Anopheles arabiensis]|uniref:epidermal growth factor receptor substrate 15-like 1 isoform X1 n=1 Tax=Anopheles arabiensis TaxID=7173 RepID=UPI001AADCED9|nr:epidermal growth factor receptor substrate 15-like 1 isoform X1 [Anopheles arabiensis]
MPDIVKIAGDHILIYEAYYKQLDPKEANEIGALDAAKFLKKSGLSDVVLSRIWDLSDPNGKGFLTKEGFFVSLKLIGLAQEGSEINLKNIYNVLSKPPKVGDLPKVPAQVKLLPVESTDWSMKPEKRQQYEQLFDSLGPMNGLLPGAKVRMTLMNSKLPVETLGRIWDLADQDRDGSLDKHEFCVAMHLVYEALDKRAIPAMLPPQLQRNYAPQPPQNGGGFDAFGGGAADGAGGFVANFPSDIAPPPVVPPLPAALARPPPMTAPVIPPVPMGLGGVPLVSASAPPIEVTSWVVSPLERCKYEEIFNKSDTDRDGLVSGLEIKDVFLQSGVAQNKLAHIWALCDTNQSGKLKLEEFCLAMWFVDRAKKGIDPPQALAPNMVPPSLRKSSLIQAQEPPQPTYSNPELEMISKEIDELAKERRLLEQEVAQKEADVRIKGGELRSLQSELDTLTATLKQLENQKGEAQKRLDDLKNQQVDVDQALLEVACSIDEARQQVTKIREQCQKQEATLKEQEGELDSRRSELQKLRDEEQSLEKEYNTSTKEVDRLTSQLQDTQLEISQVKAMVTQIQEYQRQMTDALSMFRSAIESNDPILVSDYSLKIEPEFREAKQALEEKEVENANKRDPFGDNRSNGFGAGEPAETGFGDDFKSSNGFATQFDVGSNGGFHGGTAAAGGFGEDGFGAFGAKAPSHAIGGGAADPFGSGAAADPFGDRKGSGSAAAEPAKDEFGCDPFAILHAPTTAGQALSPSPSKSVAPPRPESPSPALPPKKAKQPPPRPAPPRPMQGPTPTKPAPPASDAFGDSSGGGSFANFADFDNKNLKPVTSQTLQQASPSFGSNRSLTGSSFNAATLGSMLPAMGAAAPVTPTATITIEAATPPTPAAASVVRSVVVTPVAQFASSSTAPTPVPVADFADDPFKDYRYEDPFNIEDPFADTEEDDKQVNDPFASTTKNNNNVLSAFDANFGHSTNTASVEELDELFKGVRISGDGANTPVLNNSKLNNTTSRLNNNNNTLSPIGTTTKSPFTSDPFDAFNDNFSKNTNQTDGAVSLFGAFGNGDGGDALAKRTGDDSLFDAFRATTGSSTTSPTTVPPTGASSTATTTLMMLKSFEDEFSKMDATNVLNNNLTTSSGSNNEFDAKFDDAFSAFGTGASSTTNSSSSNIARYGAAFGATLPPPAAKSFKPNGGPSTTGSLKRPDGSADPPKVLERFNADYSKGETFDADLEAVLQRSLVEK